MLEESGLVSPEQLKMAMDFQKSVGGKLGAIIVKLGFIEDATLTNFIARQQGIPVVNLEELVVPENLFKRIPRKLIDKHHVVPIRFHDGVLTVATSDPYDYEAMEEIQLAVDQRVDLVLADHAGHHRAVHARGDASPGEGEEQGSAAQGSRLRYRY
jgi:type IV pilus assembly protein PilB